MVVEEVVVMMMMMVVVMMMMMMMMTTTTLTVGKRGSSHPSTRPWSTNHCSLRFDSTAFTKLRRLYLSKVLHFISTGSSGRAYSCISTWRMPSARWIQWYCSLRSWYLAKLLQKNTGRR